MSGTEALSYVAAFALSVAAPSISNASSLRETALDAVYEQCPRILRHPGINISSDAVLHEKGYEPDASGPRDNPTVGRIFSAGRTVDDGTIGIGGPTTGVACSVVLRGAARTSAFQEVRNASGRLALDLKPIPSENGVRMVGPVRMDIETLQARWDGHNVFNIQFIKLTTPPEHLGDANMIQMSIMADK